MTVWPEGDAEGDFDFMDPTDVNQEGASSAADWRDEDGVPEGTTEHDFVNAIHVWFTPDNRLWKIRISNRWRERLKGRKLSSALSAVFRLYQARSGGSAPAEGAVAHEESDEPLTQAFMGRWIETLLASVERHQKLAQLPQAETASTWVGGGENIGASANGKVTVRLDPFGGTAAVELDDEWARSTRVSELCDAIQEAHDVAYANFEPPTLKPGKFDELADELESMQRQMAARATRLV